MALVGTLPGLVVALPASSWPWDLVPEAGFLLPFGSQQCLELSHVSGSRHISCLRGLPWNRFFFFFNFKKCSGLHPWHMEVPKLGVELELQPPACPTATATRDPSRVCDLHHRSWPCRILNPQSEARDRTRVLRGTMLACYAEPGRELQWLF